MLKQAYLQNVFLPEEKGGVGSVGDRHVAPTGLLGLIDVPLGRTDPFLNTALSYFPLQSPLRTFPHFAMLFCVRGTHARSLDLLNY